MDNHRRTQFSSHGGEHILAKDPSKLTPILLTPEHTADLDDVSEPVIYDPYNERVKLYGVRPDDLVTGAPAELSEEIATKITVYAPPGDARQWEEIGFQKEAVIRGFFEEQDAHLWAAYTSDVREASPKDDIHQATVDFALTKAPIEVPELLEGYVSEIATVSDTPEIAALLDQTFEDYPSPIEQTIIAQQIAQEDNLFRVVRDGAGDLAAVASAELDHDRASAEMTDCATHVPNRGRGLMAYILRTLEHDVAERYGIKDLYTIARADEVGMNCVFRKLGYEFSGRLINNCRMPNGWESMNVWCRDSQLAVV